MKLDPKGICLQKEGLNLPSLGTTLTYAVESESADYTVVNLQWMDGFLCGDIRLKNSWWRTVQFGLPGIHNAENALACVGLLHELGMDEKQIRSGTLNVPGIVALGKACELAQYELWDNNTHVSKLRAYLEHQLLEIEGLRINGSTRYRLYNTSNICFPKKSSAELIGKWGSLFSVSSGAACASVKQLAVKTRGRREAWPGAPGLAGGASKLARHGV
jgi:hypothetical protein